MAVAPGEQDGASEIVANIPLACGRGAPERRHGEGDEEEGDVQRRGQCEPEREPARDAPARGSKAVNERDEGHPGEDGRECHGAKPRGCDLTRPSELVVKHPPRYAQDQLGELLELATRGLEPSLPGPRIAPTIAWGRTMSLCLTHIGGPSVPDTSRLGPEGRRTDKAPPAEAHVTPGVRPPSRSLRGNMPRYALGSRDLHQLDWRAGSTQRPSRDDDGK